jgi:Mg2+ and Co2+ transporter CorA
MESKSRSTIWTRTTNQEECSQIQDVARTLLEDYEYLLARAETLSGKCERGMNIFMNSAMIAESKRAISQAEELGKLTRLAFFYIPLSFTAAFFGMNFRELESDMLSIWVWFAVTVPLFIVTILLLFCDFSSIIGRFTRRGRTV